MIVKVPRRLRLAVAMPDASVRTTPEGLMIVQDILANWVLDDDQARDPTLEELVTYMRGGEE